MNLTKANEIISLFANVGVIGSILFLGLEMRQNTEMIKSQTRDAITEKQMMWYSSLVENEDLAYIWNTSSTEPTLLQRGTPEYYRWSFYILENFLSEFCNQLSVGGRIVFISFHSLEDRIVKHALKDLSLKKKMKILTKKPLCPSPEENFSNRRSRSAKLRAAERIL